MSSLMRGKRGLVMGVANDHSIAWGIAKALADQGAELAFTYQGESLRKRVAPLAESVGSKTVLPCDVEDLASVDSVFETLRNQWGKIDFLVHAIAFSDKNELKGRYADTSRENFHKTMLISCFSFTEIAKRAAALMTQGGSMITLTYAGSVRVMPNYNVMGVAKAALEASVRYLANDYGPQDIRVNAISPGEIDTSILSPGTDKIVAQYTEDDGLTEDSIRSLAIVDKTVYAAGGNKIFAIDFEYANATLGIFLSVKNLS